MAVLDMAPPGDGSIHGGGAVFWLPLGPHVSPSCFCPRGRSVKVMLTQTVVIRQLDCFLTVLQNHQKTVMQSGIKVTLPAAPLSDGFEASAQASI
jgi:hypothetical protein